MENTQITSPVPLLARLFWSMVGPLILIFLGIANLKSKTGWMSTADIAYFVVLAALIGARWLEFRGGNARTATGEPAAARHLQRYAWMTLVIGLGIWIITNLIGNHLRTST
jgi:hypothetical protein